MLEHGIPSLPMLMFVTGLICAAGFSFVLRALGDEKSYRYWALSLWAGVFSIALAVIYPDHRPLAIVALGHGTLAASQVLLIAGMLKYARQKVNPTALVLPALIYTAAQTSMYLCGMGSFPRFALYSFAVVLWDLWTLQLLLRRMPGEAFYGRRLAVIVISAHAGLHLLNLVLAIPNLLRGKASLQSDSLPVYYAAISMGLAKAFALVAMVVEKLINDLRHSAEIDGMTGLLNRSTLIGRGEVLLAQCRIRAEAFGVLFVDIDHFKTLNDALGHAAGDMVLKWFASALKEVFDAEADICGRYGGEEFICLLSGKSAAECLAQGEVLRNRLRHRPLRIMNRVVTVTVSIGVAMDDGQLSLPRLIKQADVALYASKDSGRDRVTLAD